MRSDPVYLSELSSVLMRSRFLLLLVALLAGCATQPTTEPPDVEYIPDTSYYLLMAEIAVQRKDYLIAAQEYLDAAKRSTDPEIASRATEIAFEFGYDGLAMSGARIWVKLDPTDTLAHDYAGRLYLRRNDLDRALHHWQMALGPVAERSDDSYVSLGADLSRESNVDGVTTLLIRLAVEDPNSTGLRFALARAAYRSGAYALALDSARRAAEKDPTWIQAQILTARSLLATGASYEALQHMERLLVDFPGLGLELEYVRMLERADRGGRARDRLRNLAASYGPHPELIRTHGMLSLDAGAMTEAKRDFTELASRGDNVYESLFYLGQIAADGEDYWDAIRALDRIRGGPYLLPAQLRIVGAYAQLGLEEAALEHLDAFSAEYPRYAVEVLPTRAQLYHRMDRYDEALETYDRLINYKPDKADFLVARAVLLDEAGQTDEAIEGMEQAVAIAPGNAAALNTLGYTLANRTNRYREGYNLIRLALEIDSGSPAIIDSMGWVLFRMGQVEEARSYLELAYSLLDDPEVVAHLGEVLWVSGERERAKALWDASLADHPDYEPLRKTRARFVQ
jgi:tetratricopeptide (TPR) repeat protein